MLPPRVLQARKGEAHVLRVDLAEDRPDSEGNHKYILSFESQDYMQAWTKLFKDMQAAAAKSG